MPKNEKFSPKDIANRIKSKGLQKLRWYCQMCQKQCRDQNGFKCHLMSESHQRQLLLFAEDTDTYLGEFSANFEKGFMDMLRRSHGTKRVKANEVYQDYIKDRNHVHMNSTRWHTLTGFVMYLGRAGKCHIDNTEKGWFIQYIDSEEEMRKEKSAQKTRHDQDDEERMQRFVDAQVQRGQESVGDEEETGSRPTEMIKSDDQKIEFTLFAPTKPTPSLFQSPSTSRLPTPVFTGDVKPDKRLLDAQCHSDAKKMRRDESSYKEGGEKKERLNDVRVKEKRSALDEIREMEERKKEKDNRKDHWLHEGIVVKVITKKLGPDYHKKKGVVTSLVDDYTANVRLLDEKGDVLKLDQVHLETVIPAVGRRVCIVNGAYRGRIAVLEHLDEKSFCVTVRIDEGVAKGRVLDNVFYEDVSKLAQ